MPFGLKAKYYGNGTLDIWCIWRKQKAKISFCNLEISKLFNENELARLGQLCGTKKQELSCDDGDGDIGVERKGVVRKASTEEGDCR